MQKAENKGQLKATCGESEMNVKYYHISRIENKESIINDGLNANEGHIFMCTNLQQLSFIAANQIFINEYSIFEIDINGIISEILPDNVAESGSETQFYIQQDNIAPEYISHVDDEIWDFWELKEHISILSSRMMSLTNKSSNDLLRIQIRSSKEWCDYYNNKNGTTLVPFNSLSEVPTLILKQNRLC